MLAILCIIFYKPIGSIFIKDTAVLTVFYGMFFMVIISQPLNAIAFTLDAVFKGLGEMAYLRNVLLGATIVGFIPFLYLSIYMDWGLIGIWFAILTWIAYRAVALMIKFYRKYLPLAKE
ncbi:MAG TPA: hypothetical protein DCS66_10540 [Flavobacteriaceae bacterium]|nr:hypothetical protein [Flavobacteriaceae bacterium]